MSFLVGLGEPLAVFTARQTGPARINDRFILGVGGAECNVAVAAARLGHRAAVLGRVGEDPLGQAITLALRGEGLDVSGIRSDPRAATGVMIKETRAAGRVRVSYVRRHSAGTRITTDDLEPRTLALADVLHSTGITASFGDASRRAIRQAYQAVRRRGGLTSLDVNYRHRLWPSPAAAAAQLSPLLADVDVLLLTRAEAGILLGLPSDQQMPIPQLIAGLHDLGPAEVILKVDAGNVTASIAGHAHQAYAPAVAAVDPVGAGDAFAAGYLAGHLDGRDVAARLVLAMELGRWAVSTEGDHHGLPTAAELGLLAGDDVAR